VIAPRKSGERIWPGLAGVGEVDKVGIEQKFFCRWAGHSLLVLKVTARNSGEC